MTSRFERVKPAELVLLISLLSLGILFLFPAQADASTAHKTDVVLEIKNLQSTTNSPLEYSGLHQVFSYLQGILNNKEIPAEISEEKIAVDWDRIPTVTANLTDNNATPARTISSAVRQAAYHTIPPKAINKVYMHEPEIMEYICPKMGAEQCRIFYGHLKGRERHS
jgi:hypothetical protein